MTAYPVVLNFDGKSTVTTSAGAVVVLPKVQQGAYWPGFTVRLTNAAGTPLTSTSPVAQIRTAKVDRNGELVATMRATDAGSNKWRFDLVETVTTGLPLATLEFDVDLLDNTGLRHTPVVGTIHVLGEVTRV